MAETRAMSHSLLNELESMFGFAGQSEEASSATPLSRAQERWLAQAIEVGLFAAVLLADEHPIATAAELHTLIEQGQAARQRLYVANFGLVGSLADRWSLRAGLPRAELFQEGCVGLGEAIQLFDWRRGYRFSTLAWKRINYAIQAAATLRCGELDASLAQARLAQRLRQDWSRREAELGSTLTARNYAKLSGASESSMLMMLRMCRGQLAEDAVEHVAGETTDAQLPFDWRQRLDDDERKVIELRYCFSSQPSQAEVGQRLSFSAAKVQRLEQRALRKIKAGLDLAA